MRTLKAAHLAKSYKKRQVVQDISLSVRQGQVVGLLGPNGAGKTTSFYMIVGLVKSDQGAVSIDAEDTAESLQQKVHKVEHQIYPLAVELFCADRLQWSEQGVSLDGSPLSSSGYRYNG